MGKLNPFKVPKPPAPAPLPEMPKVDENLVTEERLRRQKASGRASNIVSSLRSSVEDAQAGTRISKLLG